MTAENSPEDARLEALQAAYDRVHSWADGAPVEEIRKELDGALDETGADIDSGTRDKLAEHIHQQKPREDLASVLS
jgi:hypothetical protein